MFGDSRDKVLKAETEDVAQKSTASNDTLECALFMDGLPQNFESNPSLSALASLLADDDENDEKQEKEKAIANTSTVVREKYVCTSGGGKVSRKKATSNRSTPYKTRSKKTNSSVNETQLFLKMWKL